MSDYPFFIPQVVLFANSSLFWFKVTNEHREFRNYLFLLINSCCILTGSALMGGRSYLCILSPPKRAKKKSYVVGFSTCSASLFSLFSCSIRLSPENTYKSNSSDLVSFTSILCLMYASTSNSLRLS